MQIKFYEQRLYKCVLDIHKDNIQQLLEYHNCKDENELKKKILDGDISIYELSDFGEYGEEEYIDNEGIVDDPEFLD